MSLGLWDGLGESCHLTASPPREAFSAPVPVLLLHLDCALDTPFFIKTTARRILYDMTFWIPWGGAGEELSGKGNLGFLRGGGRSL